MKQIEYFALNIWVGFRISFELFNKIRFIHLWFEKNLFNWKQLYSYTGSNPSAYSILFNISNTSEFTKYNDLYVCIKSTDTFINNGKGLQLVGCGGALRKWMINSVNTPQLYFDNFVTIKILDYPFMAVGLKYQNHIIQIFITNYRRSQTQNNKCSSKWNYINKTYSKRIKFIWKQNNQFHWALWKETRWFFHKQNYNSRFTDPNNK
jgi:hypothetical protein